MFFVACLKKNLNDTKLKLLFLTARSDVTFFVGEAEHISISYLTGKRVTNIELLVVSDHLLTCNSNINFDDFTILTKNYYQFNLPIKESLLINHDNPVLNKTTK